MTLHKDNFTCSFPLGNYMWLALNTALCKICTFRMSINTQSYFYADMLQTEYEYNAPKNKPRFHTISNGGENSVGIEKLQLACWPGSQLVYQVGPCEQPSGNVYRPGKTPEMWLWIENLVEMISPPSPSEGVKKQCSLIHSFIHSVNTH